MRARALHATACRVAARRAASGSSASGSGTSTAVARANCASGVARARRASGDTSAEDEHARAIAQAQIDAQRDEEYNECVRSLLDKGAGVARYNQYAHAGQGGNLHVVRQDESGSTAAAKADLGLQTTEAFDAPTQEWRVVANRRRLQPGWSRGLGAHGLTKVLRRSIIEFQGELVPPTAVKRRDARFGHAHFTVLKKSGTPLADKWEPWFIDGAQVRERARRYCQRREKGDAMRLAFLGLAALADGAPKLSPLCTFMAVRDGLRVFLVPRRPLNAGVYVTWGYNPDPLARRDSK